MCREPLAKLRPRNCGRPEQIRAKLFEGTRNCCTIVDTKPSQLSMPLTPRDAFLQFGNVLQQQLFPQLEAAVGRLSPHLELLAGVIALVPLGRWLSAGRASTGRPAKDRGALATAFVAKAILNLPATRDLMDRLRVDQALHQFCGWRSPWRSRTNPNFPAPSPNSPPASYRSNCMRP